MNYIEEVKKIVEKEIAKADDYDWTFHIQGVVKYTKLLAKEFNVDEEALEIAAWLHDITKIRKLPKKHHVTGAEEATKILESLGYPKEKIKLIHDCILTHSSDLDYPAKTVEEKILSSADAMSHYDNLLDLAIYHHQKGTSLEVIKQKVLKKFKENWQNKLMSEAKKYVEEKHKALLLLLGCEEGEYYRHYKNKDYKLLGYAKDSEDLKELVIYKALYYDEEFQDYVTWVRPKKEFFESVEIDGKLVPRFKKINL